MKNKTILIATLAFLLAYASFISAQGSFPIEQTSWEDAIFPIILSALLIILVICSFMLRKSKKFLWASIGGIYAIIFPVITFALGLNSGASGDMGASFLFVPIIWPILITAFISGSIISLLFGVLSIEQGYEIGTQAVNLIIWILLGFIFGRYLDNKKSKRKK